MILLIASAILAISCNDDCAVTNPIEGKLTQIVLIRPDIDSTEIIDIINFAYNLSTGELLSMTSFTKLYDYTIEVTNTNELRIESVFWGDYKVTTQGNQVTKIECLEGSASTLAYCESGLFNWDITFGEDGYPDSIKIDLEFEGNAPFVQHFITRGVLTDFMFDENYTHSSYQYYDFSQPSSVNFTLTKTSIPYSSYIPEQCPYLRQTFVPAPGVGLVTPIGPDYILKAAGYRILRNNAFLIASINDTEFEYELNNEGQVSEMLMRMPTHDLQYQFTYH